ncbi:MAG TPA: DivIVA domain-containing protein [Candidatus Aphodoplasma excrementigallinarum]|uniref:DivIVA domain-containing protein n=1 Tax=Candidatus Aphodoplasma excrementigallinarum TaxID=2840673 RepID=A0A9D1NI29_9FIRM|nr:DivIVA domain-containing protein [Candidatus Aphodoplasma excrementigallinarum]
MLTPLDIENREFKKTMGGYNRDDVEDFMSLLLVDYEKLYKENLASRDKIASLSEAVEHYKGQEETMQNAILAAQKAADSLAKTANDQADLIIREAKAKAAEIIREANAEIAKLESKYAEMKQQVESYKMRVSAIIKSQLDILDDLSAESGAPISNE